MKQILVTGAGGFIGSHLCEHLVRQGHKVRGFVRYNSKNHWGWLDRSPLAKEMEIISGDLRDFDSVSRAIRGADYVFHLGALVGIPYSYESPLAYVKTNIEGTYNILEAGKRSEVSRIVVASTSEVYGSARFVPISEAHPFQPQSPYSATKIAADHLALSYYFAFQSPVVIARPFNTFGPRQSARAIIPTIISQALSNSPSIQVGNLHPTRDLTFVEDTVTGIEAIGFCDAFLGKAVNIGIGEEISISDLCRLICKIVETKAEIHQSSERVRHQSSEVTRLLSDNSLLKENTTWRPKFSLEDGLKITVDWLRNHLDLFKPGVYNV